MSSGTHRVVVVDVAIVVVFIVVIVVVGGMVVAVVAVVDAVNAQLSEVVKDETREPDATRPLQVN